MIERSVEIVEHRTVRLDVPTTDTGAQLLASLTDDELSITYTSPTGYGQLVLPRYLTDLLADLVSAAVAEGVPAAPSDLPSTETETA